MHCLAYLIFNLFRVIDRVRLRRPKEHDYDVAIVEVQPKIVLDGTTKKAVTLPTVCDNFNFSSITLFTVSGWGLTEKSRRKPDKLHHVKVPWVSEQDCRNSYGSSVTSRMLCTGNFTYGGVDSCVGDSGGRYQTI